MKKWLPWIIAGVFGLWFAGSLHTPGPKNGFDIAGFGRLPVLLNGRIQPMDTIARNVLLSMSGKSTVRTADGKRLSATEWLLEAMAGSEKADQLKIFRVQHPDLEGLLGTEKAKLEHYSYNQLTNQMEAIQLQMQQLEQTEHGRENAARLRTPFQKDLVHLHNSLWLYQRICNSLKPSDAQDFQQEIREFVAAVGPGRAAMQSHESETSNPKPELKKLAEYFSRYRNVSEMAYFMAVPPQPGEGNEWSSMGSSLMDTARSEKLHPAVQSYAAMLSAYKKNQPTEFNKALAGYRALLQSCNLSAPIEKCAKEFFFNHLEPFYKCSVVYVAALLLGCISWIRFSETLRRSGYALLVLAFIIHTIGLGLRMYLEGRPPVTNLYSSAIFIGWGATLLGLILERAYKGGIGLVSASLVGFTTLIIAHHLSLSGDTMEMLRAVLDTNLWLATHVVTITIGYSAMFVAGILAVIYVLRGFFTRSLSPELASALGRMVYGIICFATLTSFAGTVLGGIWADQSWGRFWGWDPKENGALLIVLWDAAILHALWAGMVKERGLMIMAVFGNIVTSFSWFGVNMLGVGLHSYGFMDEAFMWLLLFCLSQLVIMGIGLMPFERWASFRDNCKNLSSPPPPAPGVVDATQQTVQE